MASYFAHPQALVESDQIGAGTRIWAFAHVLDGALIGRDCNLCDHVFVEGGAVIGDGVTVKNNVCVWEGITIEDGAFIGPNVAFTNDRHPRSPRMPLAELRYANKEDWLARTRVETGCSIGANATILPGLTLGKFSFVGAGATVTKDVAPFALVTGSPAERCADVCRCGRRLAGSYRESTCEICRETGEQREEVLRG